MIKKYALYIIMCLVAEAIIAGYFYLTNHFDKTPPQKINIQKVDPKYQQDLQDLKDLKDTMNGN